MQRPESNPVDTVEHLAALFSPELCTLCDVFDLHGGYGVRCVGGAVRDVIFGTTPSDIDLVTDCPPTRLAAVCSLGGLRHKVMHEGSERTTVIVWIDSVSSTLESQTAEFELTAARGMAGTDTAGAVGGGADTSTADADTELVWRTDAMHRDFTMNSMSADQHGVLYDYFNGAQHIEQRAVVWAGSAGPAGGDATARMAEAPFRCLRYFRFHGEMLERFGGPDSCAPHDRQVLSEMASQSELLRTGVNQGVTWKVLQQIIRSGHYAVTHELEVMSKEGFLQQMLPPAATQPGSLDFEAARLAHDRQHRAASTTSGSYQVDPVLCCCVLLRANADVVAEVGRHLLWSNKERCVAAFLCCTLSRTVGPLSDHQGEEQWPSLAECRLRLRDEDRLEPKVAPSRRALLLLMVAQGRLDMLQRITDLVPPVLPVGVADLQSTCLEHGLPSLEREAIGSAMKSVRQLWTHSGCTHGASDLLTEWAASEVAARQS